MKIRFPGSSKWNPGLNLPSPGSLLPTKENIGTKTNHAEQESGFHHRLLLGLNSEAEKARKSAAFYKGLFRGGVYVFAAGFIALCGFGAKMMADDTIDDGTYYGSTAVATATGAAAMAMILANKRLAKRVLGFPEMYRRVKLHNLQLLKSYIPGLETEALETALNGIQSIADVAAFERQQLGIETTAKVVKWEETALETGLSQTLVLGRCGLPYGVENCGGYSAWEYLHFLPRPARLFDIGVFTHESYHCMRYVLYFQTAFLWTGRPKSTAVTRKNRITLFEGFIRGEGGR